MVAALRGRERRAHSFLRRSPTPRGWRPSACRSNLRRARRRLVNSTRACSRHNAGSHAAAKIQAVVKWRPSGPSIGLCRFRSRLSTPDRQAARRRGRCCAEVRPARAGWRAAGGGAWQRSFWCPHFSRQEKLTATRPSYQRRHRSSTAPCPASGSCLTRVFPHRAAPDRPLLCCPRARIASGHCTCCTMIAQ